MNYKHAYFTLLNAITDAIESLKRAQIEMERYLTEGDTQQIFDCQSEDSPAERDR